jgi:hypothetical protein
MSGRIIFVFAAQTRDVFTSWRGGEVAEITENSKSASDVGWGIGCFTSTLCILGLFGWGIYWAVHQIWPCNETFVSAICAKSVLRDGCGKARAIESIINIEYPQDPQTKQDIPKTAQVTYEFKYIPEPGKVSSSDTMRGTSMFYFDDKKQEWMTYCE